MDEISDIVGYKANTQTRNILNTIINVRKEKSKL